MNKKILQLAIPNIISNITVPLLGMVDLAIMGHLDSEKYLGAIALAGMIFNFIYWSFGFLRMGTSGFTAQAFGKKDEPKLISILTHSLSIALLGGFLLVLLQYPIQKVGFYFIEGSKQVENLAVQYFYIRIYAAPATISLFALNGWFVGMQDAKTPMVLALLINVFNILLNFVFVYGFGLKSDGVAWGTLISQYIGLVLAILFLLLKHKELFKEFGVKKLMQKSGKYIDAELLPTFFDVNKNIFIRTLALILVFSVFTIESASFSDRILAVNTILLQYLLLFSFIMDGFAYSAEALTGKYYGAGNPHLLKKSILYIFAWGAVLSILFTIVFVLFNELILKLLTDNLFVIDTAKPYIFWVGLIPIVSFASFLWDGIYIGTTASKQMRNTMLFSVFFIFFPAYFLLVKHLGNHALWFAMILFLLSRSISQTLYAKRATTVKIC
ncbi:MAG: MATE family efflux transporter [Bacteroidetes bacterium 4572_117]|nr:MAG: MATE family efflux transporter [Bacteroidetes bacterium 4572_117]